MDSRGVTPVVEKLLMIGIVVLFIGTVTAVLYGSAVPGYRTAVGTELGDRVTVTAAERIEAAVPPNGTASAGEVTVDVPATIRGEAYQLRVDGRTLVLDHPTDAIAASARFSLPAHVESISGTLDSRGNGTVRIVDVPDGLRVEVGDP